MIQTDRNTDRCQTVNRQNILDRKQTDEHEDWNKERPNINKRNVKETTKITTTTTTNTKTIRGHPVRKAIQISAIEHEMQRKT